MDTHYKDDCLDEVMMGTSGFCLRWSHLASQNLVILIYHTELEVAGSMRRCVRKSHFSPLGGRLASGNINENLASDSPTCDLRGRGHS